MQFCTGFFDNRPTIDDCMVYEITELYKTDHHLMADI